MQNLAENRNETGLHAYGTCATLVANTDVLDGLIYGIREVVHTVSNSNHMITSVLVKFDIQQFGIEVSHYPDKPILSRFSYAVPLSKQSSISCKTQRWHWNYTFSLTLAWATTKHKVQGLIVTNLLLTWKVVDSIQGKPMYQLKTASIAQFLCH